MNTLTKTLLITALLSGILSCEKNNDKPELTPKTIELTTKSAEIIATGNSFGIDLFVKTALEEENNFMLSPLSAGVALTMAMNGAAGETYLQMKEMLGYHADSDLLEINSAYLSLVSQLLDADKKVTIALANAMFYRQDFPIKAPFISTLETSYQAHVKGLDFDQPSAVTTINQWASDQTNQKITKVIDEISPDIMMFLMNALYFKGDWTSQFDKSKTANLPFTLDDGTAKSVSTMMSEVGAVMAYDNNYSAVELPYGRKNFSMVIVVPRETLQEFYASFSPGLWQEITTALDNQTEWMDTQVLLPKFKFDYEKKLNDILQDMGMVDAFYDKVADFSDISDIPLYIDFVKQNTFVDVNEEGTEAAAVTTIGFGTESAPPSFTINKPFMFAIRERTTNTLLFIGDVKDPSQ